MDNVDRMNFFFLQKFLRVLSLFLHRSWLLNDENLMIVCKKGKFKLKVQRKILN